MSLTGIGDDHPDGPDLIRDLVWGTALQNMGLVEELPEEILFPQQRGEVTLVQVVYPEMPENNCE